MYLPLHEPAPRSDPLGSWDDLEEFPDLRRVALAHATRDYAGPALAWRAATAAEVAEGGI